MSVTMLDEHLGFWPFPIFFEYCIRQGTIFPQLINYLLKAFGKTKFQNVPNLYLLYIIEDIYIYIYILYIHIIYIYIYIYYIYIYIYIYIYLAKAT